MKLCDIKMGDNAIVANVNASGLLNERLLSLGFIPGNIVSVVKRERNQLSMYEVSKTLIALRSEESQLIEVSF